jgi:hypothetical protein
MASTYSNLKIELIGTGEQSGTWGTTTNINLGTAIEEAITGSADVPFSSADVTLTLSNTNTAQTARNLRLNLTGTSGGARNLIVPTIEKQYIINNGLADAVTVKNSTGSGVAVPAGKSTIVFNNGTDVVETITYSTAQVYPGAGIPNSTGTAWGTSYTTSGSGTVVALATGASLITPTINTAASVGGTWTSAAAWTIPAVSVSGNLTLSGAGNSLLGDFSNATIANRNAFKSSTTNGNTVIGALPNGTATSSAWQAYNNTDPTNAGLATLEASSSAITLGASIRGSGTYLPMVFFTNGTERMRISVAGGVFVGSAGTDPGLNNLQVSGAVVSTRVNPRSLAAANTSGAITPNSDSFDQVNYLLTGSSSLSNPSGTPVNGQKLTIRLYAASTQTISSWSSSTGGYRAIGVALPGSVQAGKTAYIGCIWNSTDSFWDVTAVAAQT